VDLAPALVRADQVGLDGDRPGPLGRDQVDDVVLHPVAELRRHLARGGIDLDDLVRRPVLEVRVVLPRRAEEPGLGDDVRVRVAASPSTCSHWNSTPGDTMSRSYWRYPSPTRTRLASGSTALAEAWRILTPRPLSPP